MHEANGAVWMGKRCAKHGPVTDLVRSDSRLYQRFEANDIAEALSGGAQTACSRSPAWLYGSIAESDQRISKKKAPGERHYALPTRVFTPDTLLVTTVPRVNVKLIFTAVGFILYQLHTRRAQGAVEPRMSERATKNRKIRINNSNRGRIVLKNLKTRR